MLIALVVALFLAAGGWIAAWHARGRVIEADRAAQAAEERIQIAESKTSGIRLSESALKNAMSAVAERLSVERVRVSSLQLELATARADLKALRAREPEGTPTSPGGAGEALYESTTKRLRAPAALVTHKPA